MTVDELARKMELVPINEADISREVTGGYAGDLLSWVMGRAQSGDAWVTIMTNINIIAVAKLSDVSLVILAEGVKPEQDVLDAAKQRDINVYGSDAAAFELCARISNLI